MDHKLMNTRFAVISGIILAGAMMRLIPHWPNFTPIAAMALFGGAYMGKKWLAYTIPLSAMLLSDLLIGFHSNMMAVYLAFAITVSIGLLIRNKITVARVAGASLTASIIFFLVTNFSAWLASPQLYTRDLAGLMHSYIAGLAFFNDGSYGISFFMNEVTGSLFYNTLFFGAFYLVCKRFPALSPLKQPY
jgi:hypothetical protein